MDKDLMASILLILVFDCFFLKAVIMNQNVQSVWKLYQISKAKTKDQAAKCFLLWVIPFSWIPFLMLLMAKKLAAKIKQWYKLWKDLPEL